MKAFYISEDDAVILKAVIQEYRTYTKRVFVGMPLYLVCDISDNQTICRSLGEQVVRICESAFSKGE